MFSFILCIISFLHLEICRLAALDVDHRVLAVGLSLLWNHDVLEKLMLAELPQPLLHLVHCLQFLKVIINSGLEALDLLVALANMVFMDLKQLLLLFICGGHSLILFMDLIIFFCLCHVDS